MFLHFIQAGEISHALDLCFQNHHYEILDQIADDLDENSTSEMTQRVADYYMGKGLFDRAMEILIRTKKTDEAMKLCSLHSVPLTEELVDKMCIPKKDDGKDIPLSWSSDQRDCKGGTLFSAD